MPKHDDLKKPVVDFLEHSNMIEKEPPSGPALDDAVAAWKRLVEKPRINEQDVLDCHALLMASRTTIPDEAKGKWRTVNTRVGKNRNPDFSEVPKLIVEWITSVNELLEAEQIEDTEQTAIDFHISFERIHPFQDGNGRVGRILYNWMRLRMGLPIDVIREEKKWEYYAWFGPVEAPKPKAEPKPKKKAVAKKKK